MPSIKYFILFGLLILFLILSMVYFPTLSILLVSSALIAYLLDPLVDWCEARKMERWVAASLFVFGLTFVILLLVLPVIPGIFLKLIALAYQFPQFYDEKIAPIVVAWTGLKVDWNAILIHLPKQDTQLAFFQHSIGSLIGFIVYGFLFLMFIFIFLRDWHLIVASIREFLHDLSPDDWQNDIDRIFERIGNSLSKLIRGQAEVSGLLAIYYGLTFHLIGIFAVGNFGGFWGFLITLLTPSIWMFLGLTTGFLNLIPYVGVPIGAFIVCIIGLVSFEFNAIGFYPAVLAVVWFGLTVDHKMLTPKVIGRSVSIHELWVYIAIYVGYKLGGLVGVILALPAMTVVSEMIKHSWIVWREHREIERKKEIV